MPMLELVTHEGQWARSGSHLLPNLTIEPTEHENRRHRSDPGTARDLTYLSSVIGFAVQSNNGELYWPYWSSFNMSTCERQNKPAKWPPRNKA
ncbi:predicted protein [Chaetomium globosum CBS 148.51]|uniref:Uncharacterized protein n=1 Tax=Chaetomium globosum (strain ATCC 6205 / CBS 148.51 / DSM 1962 / NBRC 6347 / NRRL 1970) TaxID=306901 RepID=Q2H776_CHAGB|nr:uncharacterized protein CHGG_05489 [Chaetomium globosum CBS 148.51]EAQ88870.1 predicted protein [Chaetomium globosum CBS 148.51]